MNRLVVLLASWKPEYTARLLVVLAVVMVGSLPVPERPAVPRPAQLNYRPPEIKWPARIFDAGLAPLAAGIKLIPAARPAGVPDPAGVDAPAVQPPVAEDSPAKKIVAGWLPFWDTQEGLRVLNEVPEALTEVSPFWYELSPEGGIINHPGSDDRQVIDLIKTRGKKIFPTISSPTPGLAASVVADPVKRAFHIQRILERVQTHDFDGIDIDYEKLGPGDRDAFSLFARELGTALRAQGKSLIVTVYPKTGEPGGWSGPQSHDYAALGEAADFIRIMAYDKHYAGGPPGPVAPINWVEQVAAFAVTKIPRHKIVLGVPAYGYDWPAGGRAKSVVHDEAAAQSLALQAAPQWDASSASSFYKYHDGVQEHTVWFENAQSLEIKFDLAKRYQLGGVAIWRLGREDKSAYLYLKSRFQE